MLAMKRFYSPILRPRSERVCARGPVTTGSVLPVWATKVLQRALPCAPETFHLRGKTWHDREPRSEQHHPVQVHQGELIAVIEAVLRSQPSRQRDRPTPSDPDRHRPPHTTISISDLPPAACPALCHSDARQRHPSRPAGFHPEHAILTVPMSRQDGSTAPSEVTFLVERAAEGGLTARALGESIFTEARGLQDLHAKIRDAVHCHFEEGEAPTIIRLQFTGAGV